jgi:hypothetical protein
MTDEEYLARIKILLNRKPQVAASTSMYALVSWMLDAIVLLIERSIPNR